MFFLDSSIDVTGLIFFVSADQNFTDLRRGEKGKQYPADRVMAAISRKELI
jgi:hypothetical protein